MDCSKEGVTAVEMGVDRACAGTITLMGNPNVGKSALFGKLTGRYVNVSNFPGTTVEVSRTALKLPAGEYILLDAPGANSLVPFSEDEAIARDTLLDGELVLCVVVCDSKNLARGLSLLAQVADFGVKSVLALNMWDELTQRKMRIKTSELSKILGVPVVATVATDGSGIGALKESLGFAAVAQALPAYSNNIEQAINQVSGVITSRIESISEGLTSKRRKRLLAARRGLSIALLSRDRTILRTIRDVLDEETLRQVETVVSNCSIELGGNIRGVVEEQRISWAEGLAAGVTQLPRAEEKASHEILSSFLTHPRWGFIPAVLVLVLMYWFVGDFAAGAAVGFLEETLFGSHVIPWLQGTFSAVAGEGLIYRLFLGDYGVVSMGLTYAVAIILPIVTAFFLFFGFLEDSGYLPRLAVLLNNACKKIGLNGKSIVPMVLGLGCDTMAVVTTRVLESRRDKLIVSALLTMAIPCSAKLGVLLAMAGGFSGESFAASGLRASIWLLSIVVTIYLIGYVVSRLAKGPASDLIIDLPPLRIPSMGNIWLKTYSRLKWYTFEAVPLFIYGTLFLFTIYETGLLDIVRASLEPLVQGMLGLPVKATDAILMGFFRRDYGAAGFTIMFKEGGLSGSQLLVSMVVITFLVPCIAQVLILKKEMGSKIAFGMVTASIVYALVLGGVVNIISKLAGV